MVKVRQVLGTTIAITAGVDFDVSLFSEIRKQTFLYENDEAIVRTGTKIRILVLFEDEIDAAKGYAALKQAQSDQLPWKVFMPKMRQRNLYVESEIISLISHWLCNMDLKQLGQVKNCYI